MADGLDDEDILRAIADDVMETLVSEEVHAVAPRGNGGPRPAPHVQASPIDEAVLDAWVDDVLEALTAEMTGSAKRKPLRHRRRAGLTLAIDADASIEDSDRRL